MIGGYSPEAHEKPLHGYQNFAAEWALDKLYVKDLPGCGLFLDPGLGKTRTTLTIIDFLQKVGEVKRALIVAPLRPVYAVWPGEVDRWGFPQSKVILHGQHATAMAHNQAIEFVNYEGLEKLKHIKKRWDLIVFDESTWVKTWKSERTKNAKEIIKNIPKRMILTGTPASNSLADLHAQIFMIDNGERLGKTVTMFRNRFMVQSGWRGRQWKVREGMGVGRMIKDAIKDVTLRMQAEDFLDMPKLVHNEIWCTMPETPYKQYRRLKRELYAELDSGEVFALNQASAYTKCRQFANGQILSQSEPGAPKEVRLAHREKVNALYELNEELSGKPLLILYWFNQDREAIMNSPGSPFKGCPVIKGGMNPNDVAKVIDGWNSDKHRAIICQWAATSHGLNMQYGQCADIACFGIVDSLDIFEQAYRRVYRQGVAVPQIRVHKILTRGTVDEVMVERLQGKHETQSSFLNALKRHAKGD